MTWRPLISKESSHYNIFGTHQRHSDKPWTDELALLKQIFPNGEANELNFVLFGTSGVHGMYGGVDKLRASCEKYGFEPLSDEAIEAMEADDPDFYHKVDVTFLVVHPRTVTLRYGNVTVKTMADIEFLERLRDTSAEAVKEWLK